MRVEQLLDNDFSLLPRRYIPLSTAQTDVIDLRSLWAEIKTLDARSQETARKMDTLLAQLEHQLD